MPAIINGVLRCANPFQVVEPPAWWLRDMLLFDDRLVIFPSQKRATMILARKATKSAGEPLHDLKGLTQNPDTILMAEHRLVRVCEILPGVLWDQRVFQKLAAHDIQRLGGATKVADLLDDRDATNRARIDRQQADDLHAISMDAYRGMKHRIGERVSMVPNALGRGTVTPNPVSVRVPTTAPARSPVVSPSSPQTTVMAVASSGMLPTGNH